MGAYWGNYLTATTTYFDANDPHQGTYGIFVSNAGDLSVPSSITHSYASNMNDSAYYVGACQRQCNTTLDDAHGENSALGYSGTNAGGQLTIKSSEFDNNRSGIVPNTLNNDDSPPPQDGRCPGSATQSCMLITHNNVHDNNNPNVPGSGIASSAPVGAGIELSGGSYDTVANNNVHDQGAWGIVIHDYPDTETPPSNGTATCQGGLPSGGATLPAPVHRLLSSRRATSSTTTRSPTTASSATRPTATWPHSPRRRTRATASTGTATRARAV